MYDKEYYLEKKKREDFFRNYIGKSEAIRAIVVKDAGPFCNLTLSDIDEFGLVFKENRTIEGQENTEENKIEVIRVPVMNITMWKV